MLSRSKDLGKIVDGDSRYINGFVSTDTLEFEFYLREMLHFHQPSSSFQIVNGDSVGEDNHGYELLVKDQNRFPIECVDLPLPSYAQSKKFKVDLGFVPMSWFRLHGSGDATLREVVGIAKTLAEQRQNLAVVNQSNMRAYVALSEFYIQR